MKLSPGLRLFATTLLLGIAAGAVWWIVGLPLGAGLLRGGAEVVLRRNYAFDEGSAVRIAYLALLVCFTDLVAPSATGKWLALGAIGAVAAFIEPERGPGAAFAMILLVIAVPSVTEMGAPVRQLVGGLAAGVVVALPQTLEFRMGLGPTVGLALVRGVFYFAPLLVLTPFLERWVLKRAGV